jgi:hypothetical protein
MDPSNLTPSALALVFRTLAGASQHKAAHALYHRLVSRVPTGESSPLFAVQVLSPLAVSVRYHSFVLCRQNQLMVTAYMVNFHSRRLIT